MISSNYLTPVVLFQRIVLCGNTQPSDNRSRSKQLAAAEENPLDSNYGVLMILNCSESLDNHLCGECVFKKALGLGKLLIHWGVILKRLPAMPFTHDQFESLLFSHFIDGVPPQTPLCLRWTLRRSLPCNSRKM